MKYHPKQTNVAVSLLGAALALASLSAQAFDGTVTFTGTINAQTCTVKSPGGGSIAVAMPTIGVGALSAVGATTGSRVFAIDLTGCKEGQVRAGFESGASVDPATGRLINTAKGETAAKNVQIALKNMDETDIWAGDPTTSKQVTIGGDGTAKLNYIAQYYATAAATAGVVNSNVTFSLDYE